MVKTGNRVRIKICGHRLEGKVGVVLHVSAAPGVGCPICVQVPGYGCPVWCAPFEIEPVDEPAKEDR